MTDPTRGLSHDNASATPTGPATAAGTASEQLGEAVVSTSGHASMRFRQLFPVFLAQFTLYVAFVAPTAFSLAIRVAQIAPIPRTTSWLSRSGFPASSGSSSPRL